MEKQHIQSVLVKQSNKDKQDYWVQLNAIVDRIRFILCRGLAFCGHDESQGLSDKGNFLELLQFWRITMNLSMKCCNGSEILQAYPLGYSKRHYECNCT